MFEWFKDLKYNCIMNLEGFKTVKEYADLKLISVQAVYQKIEKKQLKIKKVGHLTLVKEI